MTTTAQWVAAARPRTLPAAVSAVVVGTAVAYGEGDLDWGAAALALVVAVGLQVAVNYSNDYSDGIRGTDADRVGPLRLVGSGTATPEAVKRAAFLAFGIAALAGLVLVAVTGTWELLAVGVVAILAAWYYTGGSRPYGYRGLGEVSVFVFFGLVAVVGTTYVQTGRWSFSAVLGGVACGALSCAILVANNLRDIPTDVAAGKRTLAVAVGDTGTRRLYAVLLALPYVVTLVLAWTLTPWVLLALASAPLALPLVRRTSSGALGRDLVPVLAGTGRVQLAYAALVAAGIAVSVAL